GCPDLLGSGGVTGSSGQKPPAGTSARGGGECRRTERGWSWDHSFSVSVDIKLLRGCSELAEGLQIQEPHETHKFANVPSIAMFATRSCRKGLQTSPS